MRNYDNENTYGKTCKILSLHIYISLYHLVKSIIDNSVNDLIETQLFTFANSLDKGKILYAEGNKHFCL